MKTLLSTLVVATFFAMALPAARGQDSISIEFFYDNLSPHGDWFDAGDYGYVWQPYDVRDDWRPYSDGRWVYTDAGWTWDSVEPYGWAVYHYGRWANIREVGWVWVPGTEWGPGWVSWRRSPEYVGWAPLPPEARFSVSIGISSWADDYYDIGPGHYRFVEGRHFGAPRLNNVFVDQSQNLTIINQTTNITNITYRDNVVYNGGPEYDDLARRSSEPISRYRLERRRDFDGNKGQADTDYFQSRVEGDSYSVVAPRLREGGEGKPAKIARTVSEAEVDRGWRDVGNAEQETQLRAKMKSDQSAPADLPKQAEIVTRPGRNRAEAKGGETDPRGSGREQGKGEKGGDQTGMRNLPPEPGAPRPNREAPGNGAAKKGNDRPDPGNQVKGKGKESDGNPAAPRPNRMPVETPAPGKGGNGANEGKGKADREDRPANPGAGANDRSREEGRPSPNRESGEKGARPDRAAPAPAPAPENRPEPQRERMQNEGRGPAPRTPGAGFGEKGRPGPGKSNERDAEKEREKEKGRPGN